LHGLPGELSREGIFQTQVEGCVEEVCHAISIRKNMHDVWERDNDNNDNNDNNDDDDDDDDDDGYSWDMSDDGCFSF
jgi:hypothetical protein